MGNPSPRGEGEVLKGSRGGFAQSQAQSRLTPMPPAPLPLRRERRNSGGDRASVANVLASSRMRCPRVFQNHEP